MVFKGLKLLPRQPDFLPNRPYEKKPTFFQKAAKNTGVEASNIKGSNALRLKEDLTRKTRERRDDFICRLEKEIH